MSFDRNNPDDLLALKTEVNTDPITMGYDPVGPTVFILDLLNDPVNNVGDETVGEDFTKALALEVLDTTDLQTGGPDLTSGQLEWLRMLIAADLTEGLTQGTFAIFETKFRSLFAGVPVHPTITALNARVRLLSRAEVLFGMDTAISRDDWIAARDS